MNILELLSHHLVYLDYRTLHELDMVMNMIGRDGAVSLVKALLSNPNVQRIELDENQVSLEGIEEIQVG